MIESQCQRSRWSVNTADLPLKQYQNYIQQVLPDNLGTGFSNFFQLDPELKFIETRYKPARDLNLLSKIDDQEPKLIVTLGLKGHSRFSTRLGEEVFFSQGYTTITSFNSSMGERHYQADKELNQLRFSISKAGLIRYFDEQHYTKLFKNNTIQTLSYRPISTNSLMAVKQLTGSQVSPECSQLLIHGQAITILATELSHLFENNQTASKFKQNDKDIAWAARDILSKEFKTPPSVQELANRVGVNQFKLKQLFHHYFNNTPYGVLLEIRMQIAYELLETRQCQVSVVADLVGYNHASNFSAAFMRFFSISPKRVSGKS